MFQITIKFVAEGAMKNAKALLLKLGVAQNVELGMNGNVKGDWNPIRGFPSLNDIEKLSAYGELTIKVLRF